MATRAQNMVALDRANVVRLARAALKRAVRNREVLVAEILLGDIPDWLEQMRIEELLGAVPQWGTRKVGRVMATSGITIRPGQVVGGLTERKRYFLALVLADAEWPASRRAAERSAA